MAYRRPTFEERIARFGFGTEDGNLVLYRIKGETYSIKDKLKEAGCHFSKQMGWYSAVPLEGYAAQRILVKDVMDICKEDGVIEWREDYEDAIDYEESGEWFGSVGSKISVPITVDKVFEFSGYYGTSYMYLMNDADGHQFKWVTTKYYDEGDYVLSGTIKEHFLYRRGETATRQTVVTRCKLA